MTKRVCSVCICLRGRALHVRRHSPFSPVADHHLCRPNLPDGCARCRARRSRNCCTLCSPDDPLFKPYRLVVPLARDTASRSSRLPKDDGSMVGAQRDLRTALDQYRLACARAEFGLAVTYHLHPGLVLPDSVLLRLVDCARARKISSMADIK